MTPFGVVPRCNNGSLRACAGRERAGATAPSLATAQRTTVQGAKARQPEAAPAPEAPT